jgi:hypothetical protein
MKRDPLRRNKDLARIHVLLKDADLSQTAYRAIVAGLLDERGIKYLGEPSSGKLDSRGRTALIRILQEAVYRKNGQARRTTTGSRLPAYKKRYLASGSAEAADGQPFPTQDQLDEIARNEDRLGWTENPARLMGFIRRVCRMPDNVVVRPEKLARKQASQVILALRNTKAD